MHKVVYLSLGSNVGDRAANLNAAIEKLGELGNGVAVSSFYETEPVETSPQPWFVNCAVKLDTEKMPRQLIAGILNLEKEMGRQRQPAKGSPHYRYRHPAVREFGDQPAIVDRPASANA